MPLDNLHHNRARCDEDDERCVSLSSSRVIRYRGSHPRMTYLTLRESHTDDAELNSSASCSAPRPLHP